MSDNIVWNPAKVWRRLRLEAKAAENYHLSYSLYINQTHRDTLLEQLLPTLLYIKATAILDDSLAFWLSAKNHKLLKPYREDLNGRLSYLKDNNILVDTDELQRIRLRRNKLAHEPGGYCSWEELRDDLNHIENGLVSLALARPIGELEYFSERSAMEGSTEPGISFSRTFKYGVKESGSTALEISWVQKFHERQ